MNAKLQKEIFNFLALKLKLVFAKSGIGIGRDHSSSLMNHISAEDFFKNVEHRVTQREASRGRTQPPASKISQVFQQTVQTKEQPPPRAPIWQRK